jgi:hypothetical protein
MSQTTSPHESAPTAGEQQRAGALRRLLAERYVVRERSETLYDTILRHRAAITAHLGALAATLAVNETLGVAYVKNLDDGDTLPALGRRHTLTPLETVAAILCRKRRLEHFAAGEVKDSRVTLTREQLREELAPFSAERLDKRFERAFNAALQTLLSQQILYPGPREDVFHVSPVIDVKLPADEIAARLAALSAWREAQTGAAADQLGDASDDGAVHQASEDDA